MNRIRLLIPATALMFAACQSFGDRETIAKLSRMQIEIREEKLEDGLDKAMGSYQRFLEETPDSPLAPEAIRRLADLKIEKEYGTLTDGAEAAGGAKAAALPPPERASVEVSPPHRAVPHTPVYGESEKDFEKRTTAAEWAAEGTVEGHDDLDRASTREAIELYTKLLNDYPLYERNDQVLYQMSRAYEELGRVNEAMGVMERMVRDFPGSRYIDEVQFRRAEHFFAHKRYMDAEEAYMSIVNTGVGSFFYELALYKMGWTFYKQELYEEAQHRFVALLDHKVSVGYDFGQTEDEPERKRMEDTFRVISLGFSNLGGAESVVEYFARHGRRKYEDSVYSNLGEFYFDKRRYADASATYNAFVDRNPFHEKSPNFHMRVIEIHSAGGFPSLVLDSKKKFATTYGMKSEYWQYFQPEGRPDVLGHLKTNLTDLANHYHACYQDPRQAEEKQENFEEAFRWYHEFLTSFPEDLESPAINYQLADLLLENGSFGAAAVEYERTAYDYPSHEKSPQAGYAAVYAHREHLGAVAPEGQDTVKREVVESSLKFADTFPEHEKAAVVLGAAADDLYGMNEHERALAAANKLLHAFPDADADVVRAAWLVVGHSSYELQSYSEAEAAYLNVLSLLPAGDKTREDLVDNLAASIYKQGEQANADEDYRTAAEHFLRVGRIAPTSKIRDAAEYDGAAALIKLEDWDTAVSVLAAFRDAFPGHELQPEVTKKMAYVYRENGQLSLAANEYERIETESQDEEIRREALLIAAELHEKDGNSAGALDVFRRYVGYFPQPVDINLETRTRISEILKEQNDRQSYLEELREIVEIEASAGRAQTPRTRFLGAQAALVLAERKYDAFAAVNLQKPFEVNLRTKRELMKEATDAFTTLVDYEIGEFTAAATFYLAESYAHFSEALMGSERPEGLSPMELEQYELAIEEQAYPFEEKAIDVHESNIRLISRGIYNVWVKKSLQRLAEFVPVRYDKPEENSGIISSLETYVFEIDRPVVQAPTDHGAGREGDAEPSGPVQIEETVSVPEAEIAEPVELDKEAYTEEPEEAVQAGGDEVELSVEGESAGRDAAMQ
jgi:cellulose synthase operon protein C